MFGLVGAARVGYIPSPIFPFPIAAVAGGAGAPAVVAQTLENYLEGQRATHIETQVIIGSMIMACADDVGGGATIASLAGAFSAGAAAAYVALVNGATPAGAAAPANTSEEIAVGIASNLAATTGWVVDLVNAAKKKRLTESNVDGYFKSLGSEVTRGASIARFANDLAAFFPDDIANAAFRGILVANVWTDYRCTRVSTGKILLKHREFLVETGALVAGGAPDNAIAASAAAPWDIALSQAIPMKLVAYVHIYLTAAGTPLDNWKQGVRATDDMTRARVRGFKEICNAYLALKADNGLVGGAAPASIQALADAVAGFI